ncbi:cold-shock protein [Candidatus Nomurabacteria bacterium]|nr:cold-shock protein [Candidatus Kaiserbacteria bacterium]MCB9815358.1 cold-shock protein [Candidatus Nomurabacteria bacterium]MCB9819580.1 cold-shock protein [Candidatus Nomurabacteria bacterium]
MTSKVKSVNGQLTGDSVEKREKKAPKKTKKRTFKFPRNPVTGVFSFGGSQGIGAIKTDGTGYVIPVTRAAFETKHINPQNGLHVRFIIRYDKVLRTEAATALGIVRGSSRKVVEATVKWFSQTKGFGFFVTTFGNRDVFVHVSVLRDCCIDPAGMTEDVPVLIVLGPGHKPGTTEAKHVQFPP